ncbi:beta-1,4-galactosyltransferase 7-like [Argopecten irradians]|uniref:beta-1,4-galactosyltransferase 7-like n=1 Tax=Argopecten irradians TaxID=31199 RepID=UPI0037216D07
MYMDLVNSYKPDSEITLNNVTHKMALVVPFRHCKDELKVFAPYMRVFLNNQSIPHRIYVINQLDDLRFNRAALINIGFLESDSDCDYIAMHDVDLLPLNPKLNYSFPSAEGPHHVSAPGLHPKYHYQTFIGGILLMRREHYKQVNGMSNEFWGWGGEDDEFAQRILFNGLKVTHPQGISTGILHTFRHIHNDTTRPRDQEQYQKNIGRLPRLSSGIDDIQYTLVSRNVTLINDTPVTFINVHLSCDVERTPWCLQGKSGNVRVP